MLKKYPKGQNQNIRSPTFSETFLVVLGDRDVVVKADYQSHLRAHYYSRPSASCVFQHLERKINQSLHIKGQAFIYEFSVSVFKSATYCWRTFMNQIHILNYSRIMPGRVGEVLVCWSRKFVDPLAKAVWKMIWWCLWSKMFWRFCYVFGSFAG